MEPPVTTAAPAPRLERGLTALLLLLLIVAAGRNTLVIGRHVVDTPRLPQWDMASRGLDGIHLAEALRHGDVVGFLRQVNEASVWPPAFPLLEAPVFLAFGYEYHVPRLLVSLLFFLSVPALAWAGYHLDPRWGAPVGLLAAGFFCASPFFHLYAGLVMLEVPGALLLILCLGSYARALGSTDLGRWRLAWCLGTTLFFCKFNYGLMWLVPLLLVEAWRAHGTWAAALRHLWATLRAIDLRRPWNLFVGLCLVGVAVILATGGFETDVAGSKLSFQSPGSLLYYLYVLWVLRWLRRPRDNIARFRDWLGGLEPRWRQLVCWVALPVALWMLLPPHARDFFHFVQNRSSDMAVLSWESLAFYPRALVHEFSAAPRPGGVLLALAFLPCFVLPRLDLRLRALSLALLCGSVAITVHPYKLPRFAATVAPLVWLSAAWVLVHLLVFLGERVLPRHSRLLTLLLSGALVSITVAEGVHSGRHAGGYAYRTVPRAAEPLLRDIYQVARTSGKTVVLGTWNLLSPALLEWHMRVRYPELEAGRIPKSGRQLKALRPETLCSDLGGTDVFVLDSIPGRGMHPLYNGFSEEIAPFRPIYEALEQARCAEPEWQKTYSRSGYRLRLFRIPDPKKNGRG